MDYDENEISQQKNSGLPDIKIDKVRRSIGREKFPGINLTTIELPSKPNKLSTFKGTRFGKRRKSRINSQIPDYV